MNQNYTTTLPSKCQALKFAHVCTVASKYSVHCKPVRTITAPLPKLLQKIQAHSWYILDSGSAFRFSAVSLIIIGKSYQKFCEHYWLVFFLQNIWYLPECNCTYFSLWWVKIFQINDMFYLGQNTSKFWVQIRFFPHENTL